MLTLGNPMARKATKSGEERRRPGPPPTGRRPTALTVKGSEEWREWVERGAKFCRTDSSKLVDAALAEYLKARGFPDPPPER